MEEQKEVACFQPTYMNEFQCDGSKCQSMCCKRPWQITFDTDTYEKYKHIQPRYKSEAIRKHLKHWEDRNLYVVERWPDEKGACVFLDKDGLCRIQKEYGEDYLSLVCLGYPRLINIIDDFVECSLSLSCPVAAKLILLNKDPMTFEKCTVPDGRMVRHGQTTINQNTHPQTVFLVQVQCTCISILQNRDLSIDERLAMMGFFLWQTQEAAESGDLDRLDALCDAYMRADFAVGCKDLLGQIRFSANAYLRRLIGEIANDMYGENGNFYGCNPTLWNTVMNLFGFSHAHHTVATAEMAKVYNEKLREFRWRFLTEYDYIWENYLVNELFGQLLPFNVDNNLINGYKVFLAEYKITELLILAGAYENDNANAEFLVYALENVNSIVVHSLDYLPNLAKTVLKHDEDMLSFMNIYLDIQGER